MINEQVSCVSFITTQIEAAERENLTISSSGKLLQHTARISEALLDDRPASLQKLIVYPATAT